MHCYVNNFEIEIIVQYYKSGKTGSVYGELEGREIRSVLASTSYHVLASTNILVPLNQFSDLVLEIVRCLC